MRSRDFHADRRSAGETGAGAMVLGLVSSHPRQSVAAFLGTAAVCAIMINALFLQPGPHPAPLFAAKVKLAMPPAPQVVLPRPRAAEMPPLQPQLAPVARSRAEIVTDIQRELSRKGFYDGVVDGVWGGKTDAALRAFAQAAGVKVTSEASEDLAQVLTKSAVTAGGSHAPQPAANRNDPIAQILAPARTVPVVATPAPPPSPVVAAVAPPAGFKRLMAVQQALSDFGYGQVRATGTMGPDTQAAIERFERDRKLPVTGQLSERLVRELVAATGRPID